MRVNIRFTVTVNFPFSVKFKFRHSDRVVRVKVIIITNISDMIRVSG